MDINSIKTKVKQHKHITLKQKDNASPIELILCGEDGRPLTSLSGACTISLLDLNDKVVRSKINGQVNGGVVSFKVTDHLKANKHSIEIDVGGRKFPSDGEFIVQVSMSHDQVELNIIAGQTTQIITNELFEKIKNYLDTSVQNKLSIKADNDYLNNNFIKTTDADNRYKGINDISVIVEPNYNLFNLSTATLGKKLNDTGTITDDVNYIMSDYFEVKPGEIYVANKNFGYVLYNKDKVYISGRGQSTAEVTIPTNAKYMRLQLINTFMPDFRFYKKEFANLTSPTINIHNKDGVLNTLNVNTSTNKKSYISQSTNKEFNYINFMDIPKTVTPQRARVFDDYSIIYKDNVKSYKMTTIPGQTSAELQFIPATPVTLEGIQEFILNVYIPDVTKIKQIEFVVWKVGGGSFSRANAKLTNGWNKMRFFTNEGDRTNWTTGSTFRTIVYPTDVNTAGEIYIADLKAIIPNKAKIIIVNDHGYKGFKDIAFPKLAALGVPTTWAINPGRLGLPITGASSILTQSEIEELAQSPYAEFSYHTWNPNEKATSTMTADEIKTESQKCLWYLKKNGLLPKYLWRAAFVQNNAPQHAAIQTMVDAYAMYDQSDRFDAFPFKNSWGINRRIIHGVAQATIDDYFLTLKQTRSLAVFYTHDIADSGGIHMTNAEFNYFLSKIQTGISEGWLEGTTYDKLIRRTEKDFGSKGTNLYSDI